MPAMRQKYPLPDSRSLSQKRVDPTPFANTLAVLFFHPET